MVERDGFENHCGRNSTVSSNLTPSAVFFKSKPMFKIFKSNHKEPKNFKEFLNHFRILEKNLEMIASDLENLKKENTFSVQKIGIVRFNPFKEVGSNQSFSIALLNGKDDGMVITSLYNREGNRVYGKPVKNGESSYSLSKEEQAAIDKAKKYKQL